jgi:hypothetical protein
MRRPRSGLPASADRSDGSFTLAPPLLQTLADGAAGNQASYGLTITGVTSGSDITGVTSGSDITGVTSGTDKTAPSITAAVSDEFVGPFPSWTNIKTAFGAKVDGTCSCN